MFKFQNDFEELMKVVHTSKLWWLGFGMKLTFMPNSFKARKGWKMIVISYSDLLSVQVQRRFFRGYTLVLQTHTKPIYFRMGKRGAFKAQQFILAHKNQQG